MTSPAGPWSEPPLRSHPWGRLLATIGFYLAVALAVLGLLVTAGCLAIVGSLHSMGGAFNLDLGEALQPKELTLGEAGSYVGTPGSPSSVTAYFVSTPSASTPPTFGGALENVVVEIGVCAGDRPYMPADTQSDWHVTTDTGPDATHLSADATEQFLELLSGTGPQIGITSPGLSLAAHSCGRGTVVFSVPVGSTVTSVVFADANTGAPPLYAWTVS